MIDAHDITLERHATRTSTYHARKGERIIATIEWPRWPMDKWIIRHDRGVARELTREDMWRFVESLV